MHKFHLPLLTAVLLLASGCDRGLPVPSSGRSVATASSTTTTLSAGSTGTAGAGGSNGSGGAGPGGSGGAGGSAGAITSTATTSTLATTGGGGACTIGHPVLSQIRSRGAGGATDELVEIWNATGSTMTLDQGWTLEVRGTSDATYRVHWEGSGAAVPAWGHFLIAGTGYVEGPAPDAALTIGIPDSAGVRLVHGGEVVDAICYGYNTTTLATFDATFTCAGTPVSNLPHNNTASASSNVDTSLVRMPGGSAGNCTDSGDNASDFTGESPALPEASTSPPTP